MVSSSTVRIVLSSISCVQAHACLCGILALSFSWLPPNLLATELSSGGDISGSSVLPSEKSPFPRIKDEISIALQDLRAAFHPSRPAQGLQRVSEVVVQPQPSQPRQGAPGPSARNAPETDANGVRQRRAMARTIANLKTDYERLAQYHEKLQRKFEGLSRSNEQLLKKHEELQRSVGNLLRYNQELQSNVAELRDTREKLQQNYERLNRIYGDLRSRTPTSSATAVSPPRLRSFSQPVPEMVLPFNGSGRINNDVLKTGPAQFPPDFTN